MGVLGCTCNFSLSRMETKEPSQAESAKSNVVWVNANKKIQHFVDLVIGQLKTKKEVTIQGTGKCLPKVITVAEIAKRYAFLENVALLQRAETYETRGKQKTVENTATSTAASSTPTPPTSECGLRIKLQLPSAANWPMDIRTSSLEAATTPTLQVVSETTIPELPNNKSTNTKRKQPDPSSSDGKQTTASPANNPQQKSKDPDDQMLLHMLNKPKKKRR
eukprot:c22175_g1_i1.p1 GENE.c22175_g1_i1~~c22175_g1_i1.p1  ORF type:complete len:220 (+),score=63.55 c22175_g1_i1:2-661(+)